MRWLDLIHRWTGAGIGVLLAAMGLSGTLLIHKNAWLRATVPHAADGLSRDAATYSAALERLMVGSPQPTSVLFPSENLGLYIVSYGEGVGAYADQSGAIVTRWASKWERLELWLFDFHHHLWVGETGTTMVGILALVGLGFVVTGAVLWWRARRSFTLRALPANLSRLQIVRHHRDLGAIMTPLLVVLFLTGAMLVFRPIANVLFAPLSPRGTITTSLEPPGDQGGALAGNFDWSAMLRTAHSKFPDAELRGISVPQGTGQLIRMRMRQPEEWLPNGRTLLWFDPADGRLVEARDARSLPLATRAYNAVYPIHASKIGGFAYKAAMTAAGLALMLLGSLAVYAFWGYQVRSTSNGLLGRARSIATRQPTGSEGQT